MKYQLTYDEFFKYRITEAIDYGKITGLQDKIKTLTKRLSQETDNDNKMKLQKDIKICQLKIMVARLE